MSTSGEQTFERYEDFGRAVLDLPRQRALLDRDGRIHHVLATGQFRREEIRELLSTARAIRKLDQSPAGAASLRGTLRDKRVMLWFGQPSTRTAQSFLAALHKLGAQGELLTDLAQSSMNKGETVEDSVRVMAEFFDALVIRHAQPEFTLRALWGLCAGRRTIPVISAGMGPHEHVTQSLLDLMTLHDAWATRGGLAQKRVIIVGDIARNRAARSLAYGLALSGAVGIDWVCTPKYAPDPALCAFLQAHGVHTQRYEDLKGCIADAGRHADAVYMTRLQQEWDGQTAASPGALGTAPAFVLTPQLGEQLRDDCLILHPLPRVNELPEAWDQDPRLRIWEQVENGVWVRAALLATVLGRQQAILDLS